MELPKRFKTWIEFYDVVKKLDPDGELKTVRVVEDDPETAHVPDTIYPKKKPIEIEYEVADIMRNALEEALSERLNRDEVVYIFNYLNRELGRTIEETPLADELRKIKRIILTLSTK